MANDKSGTTLEENVHLTFSWSLDLDLDENDLFHWPRLGWFRHLPNMPSVQPRIPALFKGSVSSAYKCAEWIG